jgi:hypothetical protein
VMDTGSAASMVRLPLTTKRRMRQPW